MNCIEIIIKHIADNNFDGLHNGNECGCELNNIAPCSESIMWCTPGYKVIPQATLIANMIFIYATIKMISLGKTNKLEKQIKKISAIVF